MFWNNRVWQVRCKQDPDDIYYAIKETYYNEEGGVCACTELNITPSGSTVEDLKISLQRMLDACNKPVLVEYGFEFESWDDELTKEEEE